MNPKDGLTLQSLIRYCGNFLIKAEGRAKNYKRDHRLQLAWRSLTVALVQRKGYIIFNCSETKNPVIKLKM